MPPSEAHQTGTGPASAGLVPRPCLLWAGALNNGYAPPRKRGERKQAQHRWAYEDAYGPIPGGLEIDHMCQNRACMEPTHLEAVTRAENRRRAFKPPLVVPVDPPAYVHPKTYKRPASAGAVALSALDNVWGRGSPSTARERYARAIVDALADGNFLKIDSRANTSVRPRGRPRVIPSEIRQRIQGEHLAGSSFNAIAKRLNLEGVPAATGRWHHSSVARIAREEGSGASESDSDARRAVR